MKPPHRLHSPSGVWCEFSRHGALRRMGCGDDLLGLFVGSEVEAGPANLWLRRHHADGVELLPLLGPQSTSQLHFGRSRLDAQGESQGLRWRMALVLAQAAPAWFWHVRVDNVGSTPQTFDLVLLQDVALSSYGAVRLNEHYVSHYVDLSPLRHAQQGWVLAARQNLAQNGRHPWALMGSLRHADSFATDGLQLQGGLALGLPGTRLQHEHALIGLQDARTTLAPGQRVAGGFFGRHRADHPEATGDADLADIEATLALPEAHARWPSLGAGRAPVATLFTEAAPLATLDLDEVELGALFGQPRRHEERDDSGALLAFFIGDSRHVVLRAKSGRVLRPHGHILRGGGALTPDESALTSTVWMNGVFHSMVTQGHVSLNRFLSTVHGYLGQFRAHGQRVFVHLEGRWQQLGPPSAFEIEPQGCRWIYKHAHGLISVCSRVRESLELQVDVLAGPAVPLRVTHHVALGGDDGSTGGAARMKREGGAVIVTPLAGSDVARRFPQGRFAIEPAPGSHFVGVGGDEILFADGRSRGEPFVCIEAEAAPSFGLKILGQLLPDAGLAAAVPLAAPHLQAPAASLLGDDVARLGEILPWFVHNALVHFLAPRGLEQYSGGGWGTRDVCQGPLEMLLAFGRTAPARDLLLRTFAAQNADGDWPQWFMFFERDQAIRAGDSHGDIVFWPLLALARYLVASGDASVLDEMLPFHGSSETFGLWHHVQRALALIEVRRIGTTHLTAYWHGDWNDALQPADPALRKRLCSAWTVTLHHQMLLTLAGALRGIGRAHDAAALAAEARLVQADFQRLLVQDGVVAGYALFPATGGDTPEGLLLHPSDRLTGLRYSLLPMMHAVLEDMLPPAQALQQLALIRQHLHGPDGARLFDAPMPYRGGPETLFQRAESSAYFGREIGVMYMHAHLRYAEALAHVGDAEGFFAALCRAHPIGLQRWVPGAARRQANCYYSSSDAAFADRYAASSGYARIAAGSVALEGGWRIYSSGPGIALSLVLRRFVGIEIESDAVVIDPVLPPALGGLRVRAELLGRPIDVNYRVGPRGCGVVALTLDGRPLAFSTRHNPHRTGAAVVARQDFEGPLRELLIEIG